MANLAYICRPCGERIDPEGQAVWLERDASAGWSGGERVVTEQHQAVHAGHEQMMLDHGFREVARGVLNDLVP